MLKVGVYVAPSKCDYDKYAVMQAYNYLRCKLRNKVKLSNSLEFVVDNVYDLVSCISRCDVCFIDAENISYEHGSWINVLRMTQENMGKRFIMLVHDRDDIQYSTAFVLPNVKFIPFDYIESCMEKELLECMQQ